MSPKSFADRLWGDFYFDESAKKITTKGEIGQSRTFVQFILQPLYKIFAHIAGDVDTCLPRFSRDMGIKLNKKEQNMNIRPLIALVCKRFFGDFTGMHSFISAFHSFSFRGFVRAELPLPVGRNPGQGPTQLRRRVGKPAGQGDLAV